MSVQNTKADDFRSRAIAVGKAINKLSKKARAPLLRKRAALLALADTEDWLNGKVQPVKATAR